ncbi:MAG: ATP synthase F0 subunit B [Aquificae bacterium]|nr:ATP synthase F0 subunit B [Aquificota bacterium]
MKKSLITITLGISILLVDYSFASGDLVNPKSLFWKGVNTLLMLAILYFVAWKFIKKFFLDRRESIKNIVEEAKKARDDSRKALEEANQKLEEAKYKLEESLKIAEETAKLEREQALKEAKEIAERIKKQAKEAVLIEIKRGEQELKKYAVQKALEISEQLLKQNINPQVNKAILEETLKKLEA